MIIIEGADLVGKTTLAETLCKRLKYGYEHFGPPTDKCDGVSEYINTSKSDIVRDRSHMSEIVYSQILRKSITKLTHYKYRIVEGYLSTLPAFTIVMVASEQLLSKSYADKEDKICSLTQVLEANKRYFDICRVRHYLFHFQYFISMCMGYQEYNVDTIIAAYTKFRYKYFEATRGIRTCW